MSTTTEQDAQQKVGETFDSIARLLRSSEDVLGGIEAVLDSYVRRFGEAAAGQKLSRDEAAEQRDVARQAVNITRNFRAKLHEHEAGLRAALAAWRATGDGAEGVRQGTATTDAGRRLK